MNRRIVYFSSSKDNRGLCCTLNALVVAEMENCSSGKTPKQYFTKVVFPLPEGAENIIILFIKCWMREVGGGKFTTEKVVF